MKDRLALWIQRVLAARGYALIRNSHQQRPTMAGALRAIAARGHPLKTVVDIGASDGRWSDLAMRHLPPAAYLLIEAQQTHRLALRAFCRAHSNAQFVIAAAGSDRGRTYFKSNRPLGGQASLEPTAEHGVEVEMTSVDHEIDSRGLEGPFLLKLDTHGFEVPILEGAREALEKTEVIVMECYNFRLTEETLLFWEMCERLRELGFLCLDLVDVRHRLYDGSLWQMNLVFVRKDRREFSYPSFR